MINNRKFAAKKDGLPSGLYVVSENKSAFEVMYPEGSRF